MKKTETKKVEKNSEYEKLEKFLSDKSNDIC